ncbi:MAG: redox-sensing transcriptional repressor Rex [Candidatus Omnitrophica bacterium]|nr:redox-sensing transcriptional repressor Rex [Candidatus Omnitrophota bacterium]
MPKTKKYIPQDTASRLSLYLRSLRMLEKKRVDVASSEDITEFLNVSSVQFRKDLSYFGGFGKRGVGYGTSALKKEIEKILGTDMEWKIAIVGTGKLGSALLGYPGFTEFNLRIAAAFDNDPERIGKVRKGIKIEDAKVMKGILKEKGIKIAILAVPADKAQEVGEELATCGVKAILNFAPVNLMLPKRIPVSNVDMASELQGLIYKLKGEHA